MAPLLGRDILSVSDLDSKEIWQILRLTKLLKAETNRGKRRTDLSGMTTIMLFMKPSTRTRVSFDIAMYELGGHAISLSPAETQLSRGETIADTARVLSRYGDCIVARVGPHQILAELAQNADIPVVNGLSDLEHPCQAISDVFTIWEKFRKLKGINIAYLGDGNNVANSLILASALIGANIRVATPRGAEPAPTFLTKAKAIAEATGSRIALGTDPAKAASGADVVYTDVWVSMGQEADAGRRETVLAPYQVNEEIMGLAAEGAAFMHCLPAHRGKEVTDDVMDGRQSITFQQAENRLHTQKAILLSLLSGKRVSRIAR